MLDYGKLSKIHVKNGCGKNQFTIGKFPKMSAPDTHPPHHTFPGFFPDSPCIGEFFFSYFNFSSGYFSKIGSIKGDLKLFEIFE